MEKKNNTNIAVSVIICLAFVGVLIFINMNNNKTNMNSDENNIIIDNNITADDLGLTADVALKGDVAKVGDEVSMNYTGRLQNGTVFDSNVDPKFNHVKLFEFTLGAGEVIPGWDKGIVGMKVGEKKTLTIAPEDAYGARGVPGVIPPNSTLIFDVELVSINK